MLSQRGNGYGAAEPQLVRDYSEETQTYIDSELARIMDERYERVLNLLKSKRVLLDYIAERLLEKEIMEQAEFQDIVAAEANLSAPKQPEKLEADVSGEAVPVSDNSAK